MRGMIISVTCEIVQEASSSTISKTGMFLCIKVYCMIVSL